MKTRENISVWDKVYYTPFPWAEKEQGTVSSFPEDENYLFVRFKAINWERTHISQLSLS